VVEISMSDIIYYDNWLRMSPRHRKFYNCALDIVFNSSDPAAESQGARHDDLYCRPRSDL
jgi:hypothetical protein